MQADQQLDCKGMTCPFPSLEVKKALKAMESGRVLEVWVDYRPAAETTLPRMLEKAGTTFSVDEQDGVWRFLIKKK